MDIEEDNSSAISASPDEVVHVFESSKFPLELREKIFATPGVNLAPQYAASVEKVFLDQDSILVASLR